MEDTCITTNKHNMHDNIHLHAIAIPGLVVCRTMGRFRRTEASSSSLSGKPSEPASIAETVVEARKILEFASMAFVSSFHAEMIMNMLIGGDSLEEKQFGVNLSQLGVYL